MVFHGINSRRHPGFRTVQQLTPFRSVLMGGGLPPRTVGWSALCILCFSDYCFFWYVSSDGSHYFPGCSGLPGQLIARAVRFMT